jgi:hypothetical protein
MKKTTSILLMIMIINTLTIFGQSPSSLPVTFSWGQSAGGTDWDNNFRTVVDSAGNVYSLGFTYSPIFNYTSDNSINDDISANTGSSVYLIKYSPSGNLIWKRMYNANASDERLDLALKNNTLVWSAGFSGTQTFGDSTFTSSNSGAAYSVVFVSLDLDGNFNWANQLNVDLAEYASIDMAIDGNSNVYFTTAFEGSISTVSGNYASAGIGGDILCGKINSSSNYAWINRIGNNEDDKSGNIILDNNGDILLSGRFTNTLTIGANSLSSPVGYDWFLSKLNPTNGTAIWAISEGGLGSDDRISAIGVNPWNEIVITGRYASSFSFGTQSISSVGNDDIFVAKYSASGSFVWVKTFGTTGENDWTSNNIGIDDAGTIWVESSVGGDNNGQNYPVFYGSPNDSLNLSGNQDFVFCRYSNSGDLLSINAFGTEAYEFSQDYFFDKQTGKSYIAGHHTADTTIFNQDTLIVRGGFADGFTAIVNPNIYAKNDLHTVSTTTQQMIMVLMNDIYPNAPVLTIVQGPTHGNAFVMGGNHIAYTATGNYSGNDTIRYRICESNECDEALLIVENNFATSIAELSNKKQISLYPNPVSTVLNISNLEETGNKIIVSNALGQVVFTSENASSLKTIDVSSWTAGLYNVFVMSTDQKTLGTSRFIKE